jgi:hypothetical protein
MRMIKWIRRMLAPLARKPQRSATNVISINSKGRPTKHEVTFKEKR